MEAIRELLRVRLVEITRGFECLDESQTSSALRKETDIAATFRRSFLVNLFLFVAAEVFP